MHLVYFVLVKIGMKLLRNKGILPVLELLIQNIFHNVHEFCHQLKS